jgi:glycerophosphoryl diester phosphodiesterase
MNRIKKTIRGRRKKARKGPRFGKRRSRTSGTLRPPVMRIAHRGASGAGMAPENTLAAIEKALEIGVDLVEIDIHLTADGHPVVIHDRTVDRTTDGSGAIDTLTLAEVRELDAGGWYDKAFKGQRIPTLEEALEAVGRRALLLIETKTEEAAERAVTVIRSRRLQTHTVMQSFQGQAVRAVNRLDRRIPTAFLMSGSEAVLRRKTGVVKRVQKLGANALSLNYRAARSELVLQFLNRAMGFWVWTVDEEEEMREMIEMGVGGIITNYPERLNRVMQEA